MSKRGLSARLYAPNQTLIMVNSGLPKGILAAAKGGSGIGAFPGQTREDPNKTARMLSQTGGFGRQGLWWHCARGLSLEFKSLKFGPGAGRPRAASGAGAPLEEILGRGLRSREARQGFHAVLVEGAVAARGGSEAAEGEAASLH